MVCGRNGSEHKSRELFESGVGMCRARGEAPIPWSERATRHSYLDIPNDRMLCDPDSCAQAYTNACTLWGVSLHGSSVLERAAVLRQDIDHVHATEIPTRSYVFETGTDID